MSAFHTNWVSLVWTRIGLGLCMWSIRLAPSVSCSLWHCSRLAAPWLIITAWSLFQLIISRLCGIWPQMGPSWHLRSTAAATTATARANRSPHFRTDAITKMMTTTGSYTDRCWDFRWRSATLAVWQRVLRTARCRAAAEKLSSRRVAPQLSSALALFDASAVDVGMGELGAEIATSKRLLKVLQCIGDARIDKEP